MLVAKFLTNAIEHIMLKRPDLNQRPLVVSVCLLTVRSHPVDDCAKVLLPSSATGSGRRLSLRKPLVVGSTS